MISFRTTLRSIFTSAQSFITFHTCQQKNKNNGQPEGDHRRNQPHQEELLYFCPAKNIPGTQLGNTYVRDGRDIAAGKTQPANRPPCAPEN